MRRVREFACVSDSVSGATREHGHEQTASMRCVEHLSWQRLSGLTEDVVRIFGHNTRLVDFGRMFRYSSRQFKRLQNLDHAIHSTKGALQSDCGGAHSPNLMLMVEFKDLATLEANQDQADARLQKMLGGDEKSYVGVQRTRSEKCWAHALHEKSFLNRRNRDTNSKRR